MGEVRIVSPGKHADILIQYARQDFAPREAKVIPLREGLQNWLFALKVLL